MNPATTAADDRIRIPAGAAPDFTTGNRLLPLDALRGVAISLVIFHHVGLRFPGVWRGMLGDFLVNIGWAGVDIFFAISGYLITSILVRASEAGAIRGFFVKRFFRIVPLYLVAIALFACASLQLGYEREVLGRIWIDLLLLTAWFIPFFGDNGVPYIITWSVSVEEFAYLLFGAIAWTGVGRLRRSLRWIVAAALIVRIAAVMLFHFQPITLYYFAPGRIDAIAMGGLAATLSINARWAITPWIPWLVVIATVGLLSLLGRDNLLVATIGYTLIAVASAWLVASIANAPVRTSMLATRVLARLGLVSYFVYLFHEFVVAGLLMIVPHAWLAYLNAWLLAVIVTLLSYFPARLSWIWFEYPLIRLGHRIASRCTAQSPVPTA
jgi:peptidoglycan/LPS O-acetylase OafA/YrhL